MRLHVVVLHIIKNQLLVLCFLLDIRRVQNCNALATVKVEHFNRTVVKFGAQKIGEIVDDPHETANFRCY